MTDRASLSHRFLDRAGWGDAERRFLAGDASDRSYDRVTRNGKSAVLMDAPPGQGDDPAIFLKIAAHLSALGLSAPHCLAQDLNHGFLLLEDLGDGIFAKLVAKDAGQEQPLYVTAVDALIHLQNHPAPQGLPNLTTAEWTGSACYALDWYRFAVTDDRTDTAAFQGALADVITTHADGPRVMILRDFHAENLLWLPDRAGLARVGLLDFQLAQMGQPGYDLVSLLQDARRDVSRETEAAAIRHFVHQTGVTLADFETPYAVLGAQRALRILGIFARLCLVGGKPGYIALLPRVWAQLQSNLATPALAPLAKICTKLLPEPTPDILAKIGSKCGHFR